jgi:pyrroloquinoline quinone (PQQ) biosynthesis protein C
MSLQLTANPTWVADMDAALEPLRQAILDTPVVVDASENRLIDGRIQNFLVAFYPIIRDFPQWLGLLLARSPASGRDFFEDNIRVERRHDAMWRAMGDGFGVIKERFRAAEGMLPQVHTFHAYLTEQCSAGPFAPAVAATNYAVEGVAQKISEKALRGLGHNEKIGPRGRWWLEEHAKYDDEHPVQALEIIKECVAKGDDAAAVTRAARKSLELMQDAMQACYL